MTAELAKLLEEAAEGSRLLDGRLYLALGREVTELIDGTFVGAATVNGWLPIHNVTTSIDAAVALVRENLPGHALAVGDMAFDPPGTPWATIWTPQGEPKFNGRAKTPALALCAALLRALDVQA